MSVATVDASSTADVVALARGERADVFARYAADHLFSRIDEVGIRDGADFTIDGYDFAPTFSIWTTIDECLNPPVIWERDRGWYTTELFSEPEVFDFPEGIGPVECVNVEHEEVLLIPRWVECDRVTFKYGLGEEFIEVLRTLHKLGLDRTDEVMVRGTGTDGKPRSTYLYHVVDNDESMAIHGHQAVVFQTALNPVIALELLATVVWSGVGVLGPEAFDAVPLLDLLNDYDSPWGMLELPA